MIKETEYKQRRVSFSNKLKRNSVAVFTSAEQKVRSNDTEYPYRQNSNFYYLSGFKEDNAAIVFIKGNKTAKCYLFVHKKDPAMELWTGKRVGEKEAKKQFDFDDVFTTEMLLEKLDMLLGIEHTFYYDFKHQSALIETVQKKFKDRFEHVNDASKIVEKMRLIKSPAEIKLIKKALSITKVAHHRAMKVIKRLEYEYELQAEYEYIFTKYGAYSDAYTTIVASGDNANTLHYIQNDTKFKNNELVLIDAGCEYDYYASDITRTIPSRGRFAKEQKELYQVVLDVEKKIISMIKPGVLRSHLQNEAERLLCSAMVELGILKGSVEKLLEKKEHKKYFPHGIGHFMGLDVHDQNPYKDKKGKEIPLQEGMVLTIEPGIYLPKEDKQIPKKYRGIGIRIEDDILVSKNGHKNLSTDIVKEIKDIEHFA